MSTGLNELRDHNKYIGISQQWCRWLKSFLKEDMDAFILRDQEHGYWCPGDVSHQGIISHGIDLVFSEHSRPYARRVKINTW